MTLEQADAARLRAARMFLNFGDEESADEFFNMDAQEYADFKGIEIIATNPTPTQKRSKASVIKSKPTRELEKSYDALRDILDLVQEVGSTRAAMSETLEQIGGLCEETLPDDGGSDDDGEV